MIINDTVIGNKRTSNGIVITLADDHALLPLHLINSLTNMRVADIIIIRQISALQRAMVKTVSRIRGAVTVSGEMASHLQ